MEKQLLTKKTVSGLMGGKESHSNLMLIIAIFLILTIILAPFGILLLIVQQRTSKNNQIVLQNQYYLREDIITNKNKEDTTQNDDYYETFRYYLCFEKSDLLELNERHLTHYGEGCMRIEDVYKNAKIGDTVYLLCAADGKIVYVFNSRFWEIDKLDFLQKDDLFIPR